MESDLNKTLIAPVTLLIAKESAQAILSEGNLELALESDAEEIAKLFKDNYGNSSHPAQNSDYVASSIRSGEPWLLFHQDGELLGCVSSTKLPWSGIYEASRLLTSQKVRQSKVGSLLIESIYAYMQTIADCRIIFCRIRSKTIEEKVRLRNKLPLSTVGHDGAMNFTGESYEYHVIAMRFNPFLHFYRASLPYDSPTYQISLHLSENFRAPIIDSNMDSVFTVQPQQIDSWHHHFDSTPGTTASILPSIEAEDVNLAFQRASEQMEIFSDVRHVSAYVLADKVEYISKLKALGFQPTAYLPGWYAVDQVHFDCVLLVRRLPGDTPKYHGTQEIVNLWNERLSIF